MNRLRIILLGFWVFCPCNLVVARVIEDLSRLKQHICSLLILTYVL